MARTYSRTKTRGKASTSKRLRDKREQSLKKCLSDEYVEEDCHIDYFNYDECLTNLPKHMKDKDGNLKTSEGSEWLYILSIDIEDNIIEDHKFKIMVYIKISSELTLSVCLKGTEISRNDLRWILPYN
ncbi:hypothetical protein FQR65_LT13024 [Abscondita terminalis]|nr:hypothetical protein FQR65_LT13024 [Abscondita terminalis]